MKSFTVIAAYLLFYKALPTCDAGNPFSSSVVELNIRNWRREVEDSPHMVFVNVCNTDNHTDCNNLMGVWETFSNSAARTWVKIAYWDSEQGRKPQSFGEEVEVMPTLRLYVPKKKQTPGSNKEKDIFEYEFSTQTQNTTQKFRDFAEEHMPLYSEKISGGLRELATFTKKAKKHGLPRVLYFVTKPESTILIRHATAEFRRRLLLAEVQPSVYNKPLLEKYGVTKVPALIVLPDNDDDEGGVPIRYEGEFKIKPVEKFLEKHALKEMSLPKEKSREAPVETKPPDTEEEKKPTKEEL